MVEGRPRQQVGSFALAQPYNHPAVQLQSSKGKAPASDPCSDLFFQAANAGASIVPSARTALGLVAEPRFAMVAPHAGLRGRHCTAAVHTRSNCGLSQMVFIKPTKGNSPQKEQMPGSSSRPGYQSDGFCNVSPRAGSSRTCCAAPAPPQHPSPFLPLQHSQSPTRLSLFLVFPSNLG